MSWGTFVSLLSVFSADSRSMKLLESFGVELSRLGGALPCGTGGEPYGQLYGSAPFFRGHSLQGGHRPLGH